MHRFARDRGLTLVALGLFLACVVGLWLAGHAEYNEEQRAHGEAAVGLAAYLLSGHFAEALFENWESEFLQMGLFVFLTAFLFQRGSAESKDPDEEHDELDEDPRKHRRDPDAPWPVRRGGVVLAVYEHSLSLAFLALFVASLFGHAVGGAAEYDAERTAHGEAPAGVWGYLQSSRFWFEAMQNWQSEFLAVASIVLLSVWLRQRGSRESKPVHAPHRQTAA